MERSEIQGGGIALRSKRARGTLNGATMCDTDGVLGQVRQPC